MKRFFPFFISLFTSVRPVLPTRRTPSLTQVFLQALFQISPSTRISNPIPQTLLKIDIKNTFNLKDFFKSTCLLSSLSQDQPTNDERTNALFLYIFCQRCITSHPPPSTVRTFLFFFFFACTHCFYISCDFCSSSSCSLIHLSVFFLVINRDLSFSNHIFVIFFFVFTTFCFSCLFCDHRILDCY